MVLTHEMGQYDTRPHLAVTLLDANNQAVDLTGADRVEFSMRTASGGMTRYGQGQYMKVTNELCIVEDAEAGEVRYEWEPADTDVPGEFRGWFTVYWDPTDDDDRQTFPGAAEERVLIYITQGNAT
jgi:hypothetical protein